MQTIERPEREEAFSPPLPEVKPLAPNPSRAYHFVKRIADIIVSALGLILVSPVLLIAAVAIKIEDPKGSVFYKQERIGKDGAVFWCHKLRSMYADADARKAALMGRNEMDGPVFKIRDDPRVTKVGHILRKMSIDELPQLLDVLLGPMSLVGPRPLPVAEELACSPYDRQRELVKPGLTCYWQISGRNDISFQEWMKLDRRYIEEQNLWTDVKILVKTIPAVFSGGGVLGELRRRIYLCCKRLFDILASLAGLLVFAPLLLPIALAIKLETPKNKVFFHQPRIGLNGKTFYCHKLTSMVPDAEAMLERMSDEEKREFSQNFKLKHDPRVTKVGRFIRKTSIDELPQLFNVLVGEMSLVGPRPPLLAEREAYGEHLDKAMSVRPGITGYWQVHGRSDTRFNERIEMAEYYVDHCGIRLDFQILLDTVKTVLTGKGAI